MKQLEQKDVGLLVVCNVALQVYNVESIMCSWRIGDLALSWYFETWACRNWNSWSIFIGFVFLLMCRVDADGSVIDALVDGCVVCGLGRHGLPGGI